MNKTTNIKAQISSADLNQMRRRNSRFKDRKKDANRKACRGKYRE